MKYLIEDHIASSAWDAARVVDTPRLFRGFVVDCSRAFLVVRLWYGAKIMSVARRSRDLPMGAWPLPCAGLGSATLTGEGIMKRSLLAVLVLSLSFAYASAQETCESKAVSRDGKPLAGAAKTSFIKKCKRDTCQIKAVGRNGRPLAGAAKKSFMQKCQTEA